MKILPVVCVLLVLSVNSEQNTSKYKIWGPGLKAHLISLPARYFFVEPTDYDLNNEQNVQNNEWKVDFIGKNTKGSSCRIWTNILDRKDGSFIVRYKVYEPCTLKEINLLLNGVRLNNTIIVNNLIYPEECNCDIYKVDDFLNIWECGDIPIQITEDLKLHDKINWDVLRDQLIKFYDSPGSVSLCHYIIKDNVVYRKCYGKYVGFKMFMDAILLSITRKTKLPDVEFFVNLGDWPLVKQKKDLFPIFSWCGSTATFDIVMPTYDITESTLENMGRVMLDMLSVQGNVKGPWNIRKPQGFWRGRDSNRVRLDLISLAKKNPDLFNVSLTNYFFFKDEKEIYGEPTPHVSFFDFFEYKYQINIDGTVAAYRFPYLMAGGSLIFKQESKYYEHFYKKLEPNKHYIPVSYDLSDLTEKLKWAKEHDKEAEIIAKNAQDFAVKNLMPQNIICYYTALLNEFSKKIISDVKVLEGMEEVPQPQKTQECKCKNEQKDEL